MASQRKNRALTSRVEAKVAYADITEEAFKAQILKLAGYLGWRTAHFRPAMTKRGWRTAVQGDGAGFPDLVLVRPPRLIFAELKSAKGKPSPEQVAWLSCLWECERESLETYVWRPADIEEIERRLAR